MVSTRHSGVCEWPGENSDERATQHGGMTGVYSYLVYVSLMVLRVKGLGQRTMCIIKLGV